MQPREPHRLTAGAFAAILLGLGLMIGAWALAQAWWMPRVLEQVGTLQAEQVESASSEAARRVRDLHEAISAEAQALANLPDVRRALRRLGDGGEEALVRLITDLEPEMRTSIEVWAGAPPVVVAWKGAALSADPPAELAQTEQVMFVQDGSLRSALVVRRPVRDGGDVIGEVRVGRLLRYDPPVQNAYLRPYALTADIEQRMQTAVTLRPPGGAGRLIRASDGTPLATLDVAAPPAEFLLRDQRRRFIDIKSFWAALLGGWVVWGLWGFYQRSSVGDGRRAPLRVAGRFALWALALAALRAALLALDVPGRWQVRRAPLASLFDPTYLASTYGFGLMRSTGDLLVTALFVAVFAFALLGLLRRLRAQPEAPPGPVPTRRCAAALGIAVAAVWAEMGVAAVLAGFAHHSVLDSTLDLFARTGLLPPALVLAVLCALLVLVLAFLLVGVGGWMAALRGIERVYGRLPARDLAAGSVVVALAGGAGYLLAFAGGTLPDTAALLFAGGTLVLALALRVQRHLTWESLTLRRVLVAVLGLTALLYPMLYGGLEASRDARMADAAATFDESRDPRALFALTQTLNAAAEDDSIRALLAAPADSLHRVRLDDRAADLVRTTLLGALAGYDVTLALYHGDGRLAGRYSDAPALSGRSAQEARDADDFALLRVMHEERSGAGPTVEPITGERETDRFQYLGVIPLGPDAWAMARARPQVISQDLAAPFPRVLLPSGDGGGARDLAIALFRDGVLVRGVGRDFGRYRLDDEVLRRLRTQPVLWRSETIRGEPFITRYERQAQGFATDAGRPPGGTQRVVVVRVAALSLFDHLFFVLRLTIAGLLVGLPLWAFGLVMRRRAGLLPSPRQRFQDRVLNAFLGVGILSVAAVGLVGLGVMTGESTRAVESWLRQHLERVEETLAMDARPGELPYQVLERTPVDSLARRVGLDLNVYREGTLVASSRPALVRDRLISPRLPGAAYRSLVFDGFRFTTTDEAVGRFHYTAGFRALPDETGRPRYVLSVPTLPEQERIEEEQARMVAYLFGALLLLLFIVLATAFVLARALALPIARLREGLRNVARGQFQATIPVTSRDEIGDLVRTFNEMQGQLAESRRQLAQQERQLAWREMARQVAHEIKNPLTPMKLSIQHLRRAFDDLGDGDRPADGRFARLFDRVTRTLIEQTDALARIAGDFSSFARLPRRLLEPLDLNGIVEEAARLMQEEEGAEIVLDLAPEPLVLEADREELRRVYINLMKNALQAMSEREEKRVRVTTARSADGREASSTVEDHGTGIPEALRARIFEPNFSTKTSGTGLGLAIVRKAVEEHGGRIGFETEEGVGTTFHIALPLQDG